jgi:2,3-bisphosphoglycerate-independent phosphoglycerate mutase
MLDLIAPLVVPNDSKIVLLSLDGLGGLPRPETGKSELETARIPNLDRLASEGACGLLRHVAPGITPGSGPGHLGLFGYDPLRFLVGRGVLEALGIEYDLRAGDVAARGNFCTVDGAGLITDRRAGRIPTEVCVKLTERLKTIKIPGVDVIVEPVKEHRFVLVLRGAGLGGRLSETDPQVLGKAPLPVRALDGESTRSAEVVNTFVEKARPLLADAAPANMVLLRGFDRLPDLPRFPEAFGLRAAAIAAYPMYRGLAKVVGMDVLKTGGSFADEVATLREHWQSYDFFFVHYKDTDKAGEDGDFDAKVAALERFDAFVPEIQALRPDVLIVSGDHYSGADPVTAFNERACAAGTLGLLPAQHLMPLVMANALRLTKFGA